ncbi:uncharacterized protein N0V89_006756 [Didymosphaeria variabile]|uniref:Xylanolytic transcriptional activator regulatory domain-containing protein n=1 Tax=Didymosphaeria variabile TaxID=1932322 RepID=A0A9W9C8U7_9PLEO|nr:uncharacterized protein N0V89_006756 [Didymosphaeria variabile]KAJ4351414.1 hypothetical protein N0V89_006756 [Didymosphaeria variabile]
MVFLLGGYLFRHMRLLGLDKPTHTAADETVDPKRELENRVVWACYTIDVIVASGVDKNSAWRGDSPDIPLPCSDAEFLSQIPSNASFLLDALENPIVVRSLELPALSAILIHLRDCIRESISTSNIWEPISPFMSILQRLEAFYANLPPRYLLTELNMYMHKDQHTLGALVSLHLFYHAAMCDLTRISLPGFNFPLAAGFRNATDEFTAQCQDRCLFHAKEVANIVWASKSHGRLAFDDSFAADATSESTKIHIVCAALNLGGIESMPAATRVICNNFDVLKMLALGKPGPSPHVRALLSLCVGFGFHELAKQCSDIDTSEIGFQAEVTGSAGEHHLINTALFRRARSEARAQQEQSSPRTVRSIEGEQDQSRLRPPPISPTATTHTQPGPEELQQRAMQQYPVDDLSMPLSQRLGDSLDEAGQMSTEDYLRTADESESIH